MKKAVSLILLTALCLSFCACGSAECKHNFVTNADGMIYCTKCGQIAYAPTPAPTSEPTPVPAPTPEPTPEPTPAPINTTPDGYLWDITTVVSVYDSSGVLTALPSGYTEDNPSRVVSGTDEWFNQWGYFGDGGYDYGYEEWSTEFATKHNYSWCSPAATMFYPVYKVYEMNGFIYFTFEPGSDEYYHTLPINFYTYRPTEGKGH